MRVDSILNPIELNFVYMQHSINIISIHSFIFTDTCISYYISFNTQSKLNIFWKYLHTNKSQKSCYRWSNCNFYKITSIYLKFNSKYSNSSDHNKYIRLHYPCISPYSILYQTQCWLIICPRICNIIDNYSLSWSNIQWNFTSLKLVHKHLHQQVTIKYWKFLY